MILVGILAFLFGWAVGGTISFLWLAGKNEADKELILATCLDTISEIEGVKNAKLQPKDVKDNPAGKN